MFRQWKRTNKSNPQNLTYANIPSATKSQLKSNLLAEQGGICAYTMCRLENTENCHIEHIEPQNSNPGKALDYSNMAACFPKDGGDTSFGYGAPVKGGNPVDINVNFVSPHRRGCEKKFHFDSAGGMHAVAGDIAAKNTIEMLGLNSSILSELRQAALATHGLTLSQRNLRKRTPRLTATEASKLAARIVKLQKGNSQFEPFCVAIAEVANSYAKQEKARSKRMRKKK